MKKTILAAALTAIACSTFAMKGNVTIQNNTNYSLLKSYDICGQVKPQYVNPQSSTSEIVLSASPLYLTARGMADEPLLNCKVSVDENNNLRVEDRMAGHGLSHFSCTVNGNTVVVDPN